MPFLLVFLLLAALPAAGRPADTLYYDLNWHLADPPDAFFYRVVRVDREKIVFDGPVKDYLKGSNQLLLEGAYRDGRKEGPFTFYHLNGRPASTGVYANDKKSGGWQYFYPDGKPEKSIEFGGREDQPYRLQSQWDSTGQQSVIAGNGYWREYDRDVATGRPVVIRGKVRDGQRSEEWVLEYAGGQRLYEEFFRAGRFLSGDVYADGRKVPYYQSRLDLQESGELSRPEAFAYDAGKFDRDYYGQGLRYFLARYLDMGDPVSFGKADYQQVSARTNPCKKGDFAPAAFAGGPLGLYRFLREPPPAGGAGPIVMNITINDAGLVRDCYVTKGGDRDRNRKAVEMIRKTKWFPATCNFTPAKSYLRVAVP